MTPWTVARQAPLSLEFSRQEDWSGLPFPPPRNISDPRTESESVAPPALASRFFTAEPPGKPIKLLHFTVMLILHMKSKKLL